MENLTEKIAQLLNKEVEQVLHMTYGEILRQLEKKHLKVSITVKSLGIANEEIKPKMETKNGLQLIAEERNEQINKHGKTIEKDVRDNQNNQIVDAAMQYLGGNIIKCWPESWDEKWYKPGERIDELKKAGALIAAEIDRLLLIEQQNSK